MPHAACYLDGDQFIPFVRFCVPLRNDKFNETIVVAHYTTEDDEYKDYHIPTGTTVFANAW